MTNKQKRKYLSDQLVYRTQNFISELSNKKQFINQMPKLLYKYRIFDKYSFDMIKNNYVYLTPAKLLDDPFDCITNISLKDIYVKNTNDLSDKVIDYIINTIIKYSDLKFDKEKVILAVKKSIKDGDFDVDALNYNLNSIPSINNNTVMILISCLSNFKNVMNNVISENSLLDLSRFAIDPSEKIGICSFSSKKDNKVMWSLYSNEYNGYCIEYKIPIDDQKLRFSLCPVVYTKSKNNNLFFKIIEFSICNLLRLSTNGNFGGGLGCINELFCSKDSDWSYQSEWRLLNDANVKYNKLIINKIFLGFKCSKEILNKFIKYSKKYKFQLFLMKKPDGSKKIRYKRIKYGR